MLVISSICVLLLLKRVEIDQLFQSHLQFSEVMRPISGQYKVIGNNVSNKKARLIKKKSHLILSLSFPISQQLRQRYQQEILRLHGMTMPQDERHHSP